MTLDVESRFALADDEPAVMTFLENCGGDVTIDETNQATRWLTMHPRAASDESYFVRLCWDKYPYAAPSVLFATAVGGELGVMRAWPLIPGYRPPNDICMPFTAEGYAIHQEWTNGPTAWDASGNPYLRVVEQIQNDLDNRYGGRAQ
jgi:hypothetical protein